MRSFPYCIILITFIIKVNTKSNSDVESWTGKWFPEKPQDVKSTKNDLDELFDPNKIEPSVLSTGKNNTETWKEKWFPQKPIGTEEQKVQETKENSTKAWKGNLFPQNPSEAHVKESVPVDELHEKTTESANKETWKEKWFPQKPIGSEDKVQENKKTSTKTWKGNWFPQDPHVKKSKPVDDSQETKNKETWKGDWFPENPSEVHKDKDMENEKSHEMTTEGDTKYSWGGNWFPAPPPVDILHSNSVSSNGCDDGKENIGIDFNPDDKTHSHKYLCLYYRDKYEPNYSIYPIQRKYIIPPAYEAPVICLNETIEYDERLPTFGAHRYLPPKYGEYKYLPVQRWMHSLTNGAIVMLYHPCANQMQVEKLRNAVTACLYRHVISPSKLLLPERPFALVAWGTSLEMSVVHLPAVIDFIKENALKHGPSPMYDGIKSYEAGLLVEAKLVTDESDSELCANFNL